MLKFVANFSCKEISLCHPATLVKRRDQGLNVRLFKNAGFCPKGLYSKQKPLVKKFCFASKPYKS